VALARALMNEPAVVLCDEPTGNLDTRNKDLVHALLRTLNRTRRQSFVITTHDEGLAARGDRILAIDDGRLAARGGHWPVL
jgi:ABC-type lipoprotein export system ATPase subunit